MATIAAGFAAAVLLDFSGLWPWVWRWPAAPGLAYVELLVDVSNWGGLVIYAAVWGIINPVLEEVLFRIGILQLLLLVTSRSSVAVWGSAAVFSLAHFVGGLPNDITSAVHACWLVLFGALLAWMTLRRRGNITAAIALHSTRNLTEFGMLLFALSLRN